MKINNFPGDVTDVSAKTKTLVVQLYLCCSIFGAICTVSAVCTRGHLLFRETPDVLERMWMLRKILSRLVSLFQAVGFATRMVLLNGSLTVVTVLQYRWIVFKIGQTGKQVTFHPPVVFFCRYIGMVTQKTIYFHYLKNYFLDQSIQKKII